MTRRDGPGRTRRAALAAPGPLQSDPDLLALVRALRESPGDDTVRLALADCLDDLPPLVVERAGPGMAGAPAWLRAAWRRVEVSDWPLGGFCLATRMQCAGMALGREHNLDHMGVCVIARLECFVTMPYALPAEAVDLLAWMRHYLPQCAHAGSRKAPHHPATVAGLLLPPLPHLTRLARLARAASPPADPDIAPR